MKLNLISGKQHWLHQGKLHWWRASVVESGKWQNVGFAIIVKFLFSRDQILFQACSRNLESIHKVKFMFLLH
jgi:hypothetical protein